MFQHLPGHNVGQQLETSDFSQQEYKAFQPQYVHDTVVSHVEPGTSYSQQSQQPTRVSQQSLPEEQMRSVQSPSTTGVTVS